ncbi:DUF732 domain-containing protein [Mycobacterium paraseoulense]|uniref:DUF732 domain-containing protein n=1 Tax=Mycobacterium paraseoulense TaxID=590652 RepID=A0A1X0IAL3_9MYCO|nr:DUF732 domain-containing protein [Mycobacterium paraseoulense]MCV7397966.1 DUF732 domain-containing protein [Mycobacterium paraseoulense]ORB41038.1 hypothetical protein BST39_12565 [Mycobacterium paraseoulense]BBZ70297.1 hypothetical protein MPRS_13900 [Mycobacterium paraseoulense]
MRALTAVLATFLTSVLLAAPTAADPDTDFTNELHTYGIYGQPDYHAWIAKTTCERLHRGIDKDVYASATFVGRNLTHDTTTGQAWQFLAAALGTYCSDQLVRFDAATQ